MDWILATSWLNARQQKRAHYATAAFDALNKRTKKSGWTMKLIQKPFLFQPHWWDCICELGQCFKVKISQLLANTLSQSAHEQHWAVLQMARWSVLRKRRLPFIVHTFCFRSLLLNGKPNAVQMMWWWRCFLVDLNNKLCNGNLSKANHTVIKEIWEHNIKWQRFCFCFQPSI